MPIGWRPDGPALPGFAYLVACGERARTLDDEGYGRSVA